MKQKSVSFDTFVGFVMFMVWEIVWIGIIGTALYLLAGATQCIHYWWGAPHAIGWGC